MSEGPGKKKSSGQGEKLNLKSNNPTPRVGNNITPVQRAAARDSPKVLYRHAGHAKQGSQKNNCENTRRSKKNNELDN